MEYSETYKKVIDELVSYDFKSNPSTLSDFLQEKIFTKDKGIQIVAPSNQDDAIAYFDEKVGKSSTLLFETLEVFSIIELLAKQNYIIIIPFDNSTLSYNVCSYREDLHNSLNPDNDFSKQYIQINEKEIIYHKDDCRWVDKNEIKIYEECRIPSHSFRIKELLNSTILKNYELELLKENHYKSEPIRLNIIAKNLMIISIYFAILSFIASCFQLFLQDKIYCVLLIILGLIFFIFLSYKYFPDLWGKNKC